MSVVGRFVVPAGHPSLPGHFPGQPIVPGVVLLDHVLDLVLGPAGHATALRGVRFTAVVRPDETIEVTATIRPGRIGFSATRDGQPVLHGTVEVAS
jgi:3-hydroxyacyl-[acyl-carrier-protein] dehydratase